ncbi:hypothetical protein CEXT_272661 [Caerostris extrusa]|uniref:Uncharacterized protein n=1 Tax=Caerostris extrusa TaxID=172846 RepID=A0AAV4TXT7_CAEEX|nr:hypothetical protein CEXT_272661 [Caerostris extrusa]
MFTEIMCKGARTITALEETVLCPAPENGGQVDRVQCARHQGARISKLAEQVAEKHQDQAVRGKDLLIFQAYRASMHQHVQERQQT